MKGISVHRRPATSSMAAAVFGALALSACSNGTESPISPAVRTGGSPVSTVETPPGYIRACKVEGPTGTYTFTVSVQGGGDHVIPAGGQASVYFNGWQVCVDMYVQVVNESWANGVTAQVAVGELVPAGMEVAQIRVQHPWSSSIPDVFHTGTNSVTLNVNSTDIIHVGFYNREAPPPPHILGRMTGGGNQITVAGLRISRGFTIHCDITLSNNIEINWAGGNKWHIDKPITTADCIDDPNYSEEPPRAPFNTFIGTAVGRLNGVDGSRLEFTFIDDGEPGSGDKASIRIWDANGNLVVNVPLTLLSNGNIQAHEDQPHK